MGGVRDREQDLKVVCEVCYENDGLGEEEERVKEIVQELATHHWPFAKKLLRVRAQVEFVSKVYVDGEWVIQ